MKKIAGIVFMALSMSLAHLQADYGPYTSCCWQVQGPPPPCFEWDDCCSSLNWIECFDVEFKVSGYFPTSSRITNIYGNAFPDIEGQISAILCSNWEPWLSVEYIWSNGHSSGYQTDLSLVPVSFGVNYLLPICNQLTAYVGGGALYSFFRSHDHSPDVHQHIHKNSWGGVAKLGCYYHFMDCLFLEGFFDYAYQKFEFHNSDTDLEDDDSFVERHDVDLSGFKLGVGIGYSF